ncbi:hypothetical protein GCM10023215_30450 [Pseudonocardia yuanmonensis]|uniref:HTH luxR-type domain-containing protein n=1 Tax=Pseudonocardia yuanmonensis TaxID=1095914 RepID=A0ABP8WM37_9PSEU
MGQVHPAIEEALERLCAGTPASLLVELDPGSRRSPLLRELPEVAAAAGCRVVTVPAVEHDRFAAGSRLWTALGGDAGIAGDGASLAQRSAELLEQLTLNRPVVVLVEDLSWSDPATVLALRTLPEVLGHLPVLWVVGVLAGEGRGERALAVLRGSGTITVSAAVAPPAEVPSQPTPRALMQVGAVIGVRFEPEIAADLLGRPIGGLLDEIDEAVTAGALVDDGTALRFTDLRVRDGLLDALPNAVRRALHHDVARRLMQWPGRETEAVWHLAQSAGGFSADDLAVARAAVSRLAAVSPEDAAELALRVGELFAPLDHRRVDFMITAASYLGRTSRVAEALSILDRVDIRGLSTQDESRLRLVAATVHQAAGDDHDAMEHVTRALALPAVEPHVEIALLKIRAAGHVNLGEIDAAVRVSAPILRSARSSPDPATRVSAEVFASQLAFSRARVTEAVELAEQAASGVEVSSTRPLHAPRIPELWLATVLLSTDRLDEAAELLLDGQRRYERRGLGWSAPYWHSIRAIERWLRDDLDDAAAEAETALDAAARLDITRTRQLSSAVLAVVEADRGRPEQGVRALGTAMPGLRPRPYDVWTAAAAVRVGAGDEPRAWDWLDRHANPARMMMLPPKAWTGLIRPGRAGGPVAAALEEIALVAADQRVIVAAVRRAIEVARTGGAAATAAPDPATSGWSSLTASELRVAGLVVEGHTNRAIAERLHVSVHTVGTHLRHVFAKLGINTRVELTRRALLEQQD